MEYFNCIESRRSIRSYSPAPVEAEKLEAILQAGRLAPTACDLQPFRLILIETKGREADLRRVYDKQWFTAAPILLLACSVPGEAWSRRDGKNYADIDAAIAMDHVVLAANALGLGSCWIAAFDPQAAREMFKLEAGWEPVALTPLGYPLESPSPRPRKPLEELVARR